VIRKRGDFSRQVREPDARSPRETQLMTTTKSTRSTQATAITLLAFAVMACGSNPDQSDGFNPFLQTIATQCRPLIIGSDDMGQAITFNGLGAIPEHYNIFVNKTEALYRGGISPQIYQESLTAFVGAGSSNERSINCIVAHLPKGAAPAPASK